MKYYSSKGELRSWVCVGSYSGTYIFLLLDLFNTGSAGKLTLGLCYSSSHSYFSFWKLKLLTMVNDLSFSFSSPLFVDQLFLLMGRMKACLAIIFLLGLKGEIQMWVSIIVWMQNVPHRFMCVNMWFPADGGVLGSWLTLGTWELVGCGRPLGTGLWGFQHAPFPVLLFFWASRTWEIFGTHSYYHELFHAFPVNMHWNPNQSKAVSYVFEEMRKTN